jgi:LacI family transcriptional regulator
VPTISDVAKRAGVSPATVSRVLQGAKNVRPDTRAKVEQAIGELGYVPSAVAQSLRSKRTRSIALVLPDITNTFWTTVARGVEDIAQRHGYSILLCNTDENLAKQSQYLDVLIRQQVDGVVIAPFDSDGQHLDKLRERSIPTVVVDRRVDGWDVDSVTSDSVAGSRALVQHLLSLGHERIAVLSGPASTSTAEDRIAGYCMALDEAGIPLDRKLIRRGEYRALSGEELTLELLDEGLAVSAIFAANNAIAMGVMDAVAKRGLRIPQDIALVCFDDLPNTSHIFPFLTVVAQPVYDLGVNAAQLLLSRLDGGATLRPRQVVLPPRLIVRHSCGSRLDGNGDCPLSVPISGENSEHSAMVNPLSPKERRNLPRIVAGVAASAPTRDSRLSGYDRSDVNRLLKVLQHQEADRVPHLELQVDSWPLYKYVLEREPEYDPAGARIGGQMVTPEDHVDFALRLGMDAVSCFFSWRPASADLDTLEPPPSLADELSHLERYLRAVEGTNVGIIACFSSFFDVALRATGVMDAPHRFRDVQPVFEQMMDTLLQRQERLMRVVCDRFASELTAVVVADDIAHHAGLLIPTNLFLPIFRHRMEHLITPAKDHNKLLLMDTCGKVDQLLPIIYDIGFNGIHPIGSEFNDIFQVREQWAGKVALIGNVPIALLARGNGAGIENKVREYCETLAPGGGYVLGSSGRISEEIPPENFVAMTRAVHKYGRYGSLGQESVR